MNPFPGPILVTGGAGFIGSHMVKLLRDRGYDVLVIDNLSTGHKDTLSGVNLIEGSIGDPTLLDRVFSEYPVHSVIHFASSISVGESFDNPDLYYSNNVGATLSLLRAMIQHGVSRLVFSSSAAVYGQPRNRLFNSSIKEDDEKEPISPYGRSKWMIEQILSDLHNAHGLRYVSLRYFNAAGADPEGKIGERHEPETHLIPLALQAALGLRDELKIYGDDYPTPDGTCIRDYVHVSDLCEAHLLSLMHLWQGGTSTSFNLGNEQGHSVKAVIEAAKEITGRPINTRVVSRRTGDPASLVACSDRIKRELGWTPIRSNLRIIIEDAWRFETRRQGVLTPNSG